MAAGNQGDTVGKRNHLPQTGSQGVNGGKDVVREPGGDRSAKVCFVDFVKLVAEIIKAVESNDDFEVAEAFLDFRT